MRRLQIKQRRTKSAASMPYESFDLQQPSVFKRGPHNFADPPNLADYVWVTVGLPVEWILEKTSDAMIMGYYQRTITNHLANKRFPCAVSIDKVARHSHGRRCISLPIRMGDKSPADILRQGAALAGWWMGHIEAGRVSLDKQLIFRAKDWAPFGTLIWDIPAEWKKPDFQGCVSDRRTCEAWNLEARGSRSEN